MLKKFLRMLLPLMLPCAARAGELRIISALEISDEDKTAMLEYAKDLNRAVFAGISPRDLDRKTLALWQENFPASFFSGYLQWMLESVPWDMRQITVPLQ